MNELKYDPHYDGMMIFYHLIFIDFKASLDELKLNLDRQAKIRHLANP
jgi:hypothetical protein